MRDISEYQESYSFAPEEETLSQIRAIVDQHMKDYPYEVTFLDVIRPGGSCGLRYI